MFESIKGQQWINKNLLRHIKTWKALDRLPFYIHNDDEQMCLCVRPTILERIKRPHNLLRVLGGKRLGRFDVGSKHMLPLNSLLRVKVTPDLENFQNCPSHYLKTDIFSLVWKRRGFCSAHDESPDGRLLTLDLAYHTERIPQHFSQWQSRSIGLVREWARTTLTVRKWDHGFS